MLVYLSALGCRLNEAELERWSRQFQRAGACVVAGHGAPTTAPAGHGAPTTAPAAHGAPTTAPAAHGAPTTAPAGHGAPTTAPAAHGAYDAPAPAAGADAYALVVVNTCAVTADAVRKSRRLIRRLRRAAPRAKLVISGCYASLDGRDAAAELGVDLVVDNADKDRLVDIVVERGWLSRRDDTPAVVDDAGRAPLRRSRSRAFVKVQDGCRYRCSYCIVTIARGGERSRAIADVVDEINRLHADGVQEAVLTGVHLGGYGSDRGRRLGDLLAALLDATALPRLRLGSLEPWELDEDFFALFADRRLLPHLHLPIQSGSDAVLRRMARRGRIADLDALFRRARAAVADLHISTDIIAGFPGETDADWRQTLDAARAFGFSRLHVFPYSPRAGTKAATLPEPVPREALRRRVEALRALDGELRLAALQRAVGGRAEVLWEGKSVPLGDGRVRRYGYTPHYLRAAIDFDPRVDPVPAGRIDAVTLRAVDAERQLLLADRGAAPGRRDAA